jgi:hypothetical protein
VSPLPQIHHKSCPPPAHCGVPRDAVDCLHHSLEPLLGLEVFDTARETLSANCGARRWPDSAPTANWLGCVSPMASWLEALDGNNRLHPPLNPLGTEPGRFSGRNPVGDTPWLFHCRRPRRSETDRNHWRRLDPAGDRMKSSCTRKQEGQRAQDRGGEEAAARKPCSEAPPRRRAQRKLAR